MFPSAQTTRRPLAEIAPKFASLSDEVLFGDIWQREQLSPRERSIATVSALLALYRLEQLPFHLARAIENGVQREELAELITHLAFYAGWPAAHSAIYQLDALIERD
jgi:4-carboxymuconolactone decarboxylase